MYEEVSDQLHKQKQNLQIVLDGQKEDEDGYAEQVKDLKLQLNLM